MWDLIVSVPDHCLFFYFSFRQLKQGIQEFQRKYVLVPADKAANNIVVV